MVALLVSWVVGVHAFGAGAHRPLLRCARPAARQLRHAASATAGGLSLYTHPICVQHTAGGGHPESPERLASLLRLAKNEWAPEFGEALRILEPEVDATDEQLLRVHTEHHVKMLNAAFAAAKERKAILSIDADTRVCPDSGPACYRASGLAVAAVDEVLSDQSPCTRAFVMARPPGHHAEPEQAMGFCLFNHVMVAAAHAQAAHGKAKVAVLDFDVHHGNGDAAMCSPDASRFYASSHQSPCYPGTGRTAGTSGAAQQVLSVPLAPGAGTDEFRAAWADTILPALQAFGPDAVFISAGFDAHADDPLASLSLNDDDYEWVTAQIVRAARGAPIVSYLEGGYDIEALGRAVRGHVKALIETP